jgi:hypothetical protein
LKNGYNIVLEQKDPDKIKKGDKIIQSEPIYPLPDGSYKMKGRLKKIKVKDNIIV